MIQYLSSFAALKNDRRAVTAMEYGLIAALISIALIAALPALTGGLGTVFARVGGSLS